MRDIIFKQREFDGMWMKLIKMKDFDNSYSYKTEQGHKVNIIPDIWVVAGVYDHMMEIDA
jgi:hypothetical protein